MLTLVMLPAQLSERDLDDFDGQLTQAIVLSNIRWPTYQAMLADMGEHRFTRLAYNQGQIHHKTRTITVSALRVYWSNDVYSSELPDLLWLF